MSDSFLKRLVASFEKHSSRVAMRVVGLEAQVYTFGETLRCIRSIAYRLAADGVEVGDRVALIGENHPNWAIAYLGILYRGAVCVPLDPQGEVATLANFIENSEAKLVFIGDEVRAKFAQIEERLGRGMRAVVWKADAPSSHGDEARSDQPEPDDVRVSAPDSSTRQSFIDWTETNFTESFAIQPPTADGDDIALLIYTSGTTGTPKGVPLTHGNILAELDGINDVLKLTDKEKILSLLPLFHAYLQIVNLWVATTYGCEVGYLKELSPAELGNAMKEFRPTILTTVPRLWYLFHKKIFDAVAAKPKSVRTLFATMLAANGVLRDMFGINLGRRLFGKVHESFGGDLKLAISAGSRFDEDVAVDFHKLGFTILQGYGLTETSGAATATYETDNQVGSVGKPLKGAEIRLDNPGADGVGEVLIRGPIVFGGYYKNPAATADAFDEGGWFRSGDLGRFDDAGHLYIVGRAKDVIVLPSGKNVHPEDLEIHYLKTPLVEEMAVIGIRDESAPHAGAEKLAAIVVPDFEYLRQTKVANSKEAIRYALDNLGRDLPEYQRVRDYIIRAEPLPRTGSRKIKRFELKKALENGGSNGRVKEAKAWDFSADDRAVLESVAGRRVTAIIKSNARDADVVHPSMNLEIDLGLDSLARAETFAALEHAFSTEFEADDAGQALTVRDVIDLVKSASSDEDGSTALVEDLNWSAIIRTADDEIPELRKALENRPLFAAFAFTVYRSFNLFCRLFMRLEVTGVENIETAQAPRLRETPSDEGLKEAFIICPNHQSFLDPFVLCSNYPFDIFKRTFHVGASEFFQTRLMGWIAGMLHVVPVDPDTQLMKAMKAGAIGLKRGRVLNIYPEGERAYDGELHKFKKGAAILATELALPIVPVAMDGLYKVWARRTYRIRPAKVKVRIGKPFLVADIIPDLESMSREEVYRKVTAHLRDTIQKMIAEMRQGSKTTSTDRWGRS